MTVYHKSRIFAVKKFVLQIFLVLKFRRFQRLYITIYLYFTFWNSFSLNFILLLTYKFFTHSQYGPHLCCFIFRDPSFSVLFHCFQNVEMCLYGQLYKPALVALASLWKTDCQTWGLFCLLSTKFFSQWFGKLTCPKETEIRPWSIWTLELYNHSLQPSLQ